MTSSRFRFAGLVLAVMLQTDLTHAQIQIASSLISTVAGNNAASTVFGTPVGCTGEADALGDGCTATTAVLNLPAGVIVDSAGNLYIADASHHLIRKVIAATGEIVAVAGNGTSGFSGDKEQATSAELSFPNAVALDAAGNLYIVDYGNQRIRMVLAATGVITTIAGNGTAGYNGDNIQAVSAELNGPGGIAVNPAGTMVYIGDTTNNRVRLVNLTTGVITTAAGTGVANNTGDNGAATSATLSGPFGLSLDSAGNLYIADTYNSLIRKVTAASGIITTVAGNGFPQYGGDGGLATSASLYYPQDVTVDSDGNLYIADTQNNLVREVTASNGVINSIAGTGVFGSGYAGDGGPAIDAEINYPDGVAVDTSGNVYIADTNNDVIRKVSAPTAATSFPETPVGMSAAPQNVVVFVSSALTISSVSVPQSQGGAQEFTAGAMQGCVADGTTTIAAGTLCTIPVTFRPAYPGLRGVPVVLKTSAGNFNFGMAGIGLGPQPALVPGVITTVVGNGTSGYTGNNGTALAAELYAPTWLALDYASNLYIDDSGNAAVRKVSAATDVISLVDGGPFLGSGLLIPTGVATDSAGNLYIADEGSSLVFEVSAATGQISIFAGGGGGCLDKTDKFDDNCPATSAALDLPAGLAVDSANNVYIADNGNNLVRKVNAASGIISTVAGNGFGCCCVPPMGGSCTNTGGYSGDNGPATSAELYFPQGLAVDSADNLYIGDFNNHVVRKVNAATGIITTVAGNGTGGNSGDGGPATSAEFDGPFGIGLDAAGDLYIADILDIASAYGIVRKVTAATGIITTVAGSDTVQSTDSGDGGAATSAGLGAWGVALDATGNMYMGGFLNNTVRSVSVNSPTVNFPSTVVNTQSASQTVTLANIGTAPLDLTKMALSNDNFMIDGSTTTCSTASPIPSGDSCAIGLVFSPTTTGPLTGILTLTDNALNVAGTTQQVNLNGTGTQTAGPTTPTVTVTPSPTSITTTQALTVTVSVSGGSGSSTPTGSVTLTSGSYTSAATTLSSGSATINIPAGSLAAGTDTLSVTYTPDSASSSTYNSATGSNTVTVTTATVQVTVGASPVGLSFSVDGTSYTSTQSLTWNVGSSHTLATTSPQTSAGTQNTFASWSDGGAISHSLTAPSSAMSYTATFTTSYQLTTAASPAADGTVTPASGSYYTSGTVVDLTATPNAGYAFVNWTGNVAGASSASTTITMSAPEIVTANFSKAAAPLATLTPALTFSNTTVGATSPALFAMLSNSGNATLNITAIAIDGANPSDFAIATGANACGTTLAADASCSIYATFTPASAASFSATLTVTDNATPATQSTALSGMGTPPPAPIATLTPATLTFTAVSGTTSTAQTATLSNTGNATLNINGIAIAGANPTDFAETNTCGETLEAGSNCTISVTFTPASAASFSATLQITDNASGSPQSTTLAGTGTAAPSFTVSSNSGAQTVQAGGTATYTITVTAQNGNFSNAVALSATGLPTGATGIFSPPSVTPGSASATSTLSIQTASTMASGRPSPAWPLAAPALALVGLLLLPGKRRRRWITMALLLVASLGTFTALSACGGGFALTQPAQSYTITVTGTSGADVQSTAVQLTVQ